MKETTFNFFFIYLVYCDWCIIKVVLAVKLYKSAVNYYEHNLST